MKPPRTKPLPAVQHLRIDPTRRCDHATCAGIFTRAFDEHGRAGTFALEELDKPSVAQWLRERTREKVEDTVGVLLGHGHLRVDTNGFPHGPEREKASAQCEPSSCRLGDPKCTVAGTDDVRALLVRMAKHAWNAGDINGSDALTDAISEYDRRWPNGYRPQEKP